MLVTRTAPNFTPTPLAKDTAADYGDTVGNSSLPFAPSAVLKLPQPRRSLQSISYNVTVIKTWPGKLQEHGAVFDMLFQAPSTLETLLANPAPVVGCAPANGYLELDFDRFDQKAGIGWRVLSRSGCYLNAASVIRNYRNSHAMSLALYQVHVLYWHEGQMRAMGGQYEAAIPLLMAGVNPYNEIGFSEYALGTVAFLRRDLPALTASRDRLAGTPRPSNWPETEAALLAKTGKRPVWPPNLDVLDRLIASFGSSYEDAYSRRGKAP